MAQEVYDEAVHIKPRSLAFVHDHLKTGGMRNEAVHRKPLLLLHVPDHDKTQGMCKRSVEKEPLYLTPWNMFLIGLWHNSK